MGEKAGTQIEDLMNDINSNKLSSEEIIWLIQSLMI